MPTFSTEHEIVYPMEVIIARDNHRGLRGTK